MRNALDIWRSTSSPWSVLEDVDRMFNFTPMIGFNPACEIDEQEDYFMISMDLPGVGKDEVRVEVVDNRLVVSGERKRETKKNGQGTERFFGKFERSFSLPSNIDAENIEARYENGVLELAIPKAENAKPKTIAIQNGKDGFFGKFLTKQDKKHVS